MHRGLGVRVPPGGTELSDAQAAAVDDLIATSLEPASAQAMIELWDRFETHHPHDEPHAYLSLLATHPAHRGQGIGQRLLAEDLQRLDAEGLPAYLDDQPRQRPPL